MGDHRILSLGEVDSTNEEARRRAEVGEPGPLWITATRQVGGKGRQGRVWTSIDGNLYSTLLIRPDLSPQTASLYSFAACLSVAELFESAGAEAQLKWPNDALLNGGKAAGVLLEASGAAGRVDWLAIGVGVNLAGHPPADPGAIHPPTSLLAETGVALSPDEAVAGLADRLAHWGGRLSREGFGPLRSAWLSRAIKLGERIEARMPGATHSGVFEDVDETGALVLRTRDGIRRLHAADIYF